jgi:hypothetical protein
MDCANIVMQRKKKFPRNTDASNDLQVYTRFIISNLFKLLSAITFKIVALEVIAYLNKDG